MSTRRRSTPSRPCSRSSPCRRSVPRRCRAAPPGAWRAAPTSSRCRAVPAPARTPGTRSSRCNSTTGTGPAISSRFPGPPGDEQGAQGGAPLSRMWVPRPGQGGLGAARWVLVGGMRMVVKNAAARTIFPALAAPGMCAACYRRRGRARGESCWKPPAGIRRETGSRWRPGDCRAGHATRASARPAGALYVL